MKRLLLWEPNHLKTSFWEENWWTSPRAWGLNKYMEPSVELDYFCTATLQGKTSSLVIPKLFQMRHTLVYLKRQGSGFALPGLKNKFGSYKYLNHVLWAVCMGYITIKWFHASLEIWHLWGGEGGGEGGRGKNPNSIHRWLDLFKKSVRKLQL